MLEELHVISSNCISRGVKCSGKKQQDGVEREMYIERRSSYGGPNGLNITPTTYELFYELMQRARPSWAEHGQRS